MEVTSGFPTPNLTNLVNDKKLAFVWLLITINADTEPAIKIHTPATSAQTQGSFLLSTTPAGAE